MNKFYKIVACLFFGSMSLIYFASESECSAAEYHDRKSKAEKQLIEIIKSGDTIALENILQKNKDDYPDLNKQFEYTLELCKKGFRIKHGGYNPLWLAISYDQAGIAAMLLKYGADIHRVHDYHGQKLLTPLQFAQKKNNASLAEMLQARNITINNDLDDHELNFNEQAPLIPVVVQGQEVSTVVARNQRIFSDARRRIKDRLSTFSWHVIFLMFLLLPNLCLSFAGKIKNKEIIAFLMR